MLQGHGDDIYCTETRDILNFSSNVLPLANSRLQKIITENVNKISNYPEPDNDTLRKVFAEKEGIDRDEVIFTNGATEAIYLVATAYSGATSAIRIPTFAEYADACKIFRHEILTVTGFRDIPHNTNLFWLCNPNNPTGEVLTRESLLNVIDLHPSKTFVLDLSYKELTDISPIGYHDIVERDNIIGIFSLTKRHSIPGLRVGYIVTNRDIAGKLRGLKMPWSVNALAEVVASSILKENEKFDITPLLDEARRVASKLNDTGYKVYPSETNFMLCETPWGDATALKKFLLDNYKVLIRDASNFAGLDKGCFRIAVRDRQSDNILIRGLEKWASQFKN